jgi:hypothetical protein
MRFQMSVDTARRMLQEGGMMTQYFPFIVEQESNGTFSAWVAGLPGVNAAADTATAAKRAFAEHWQPTSPHWARSAASRS